MTQHEMPNPDMPTQQLRLQMGELTVSEVRVARAAIRWANSAQQPQPVLAGQKDLIREQFDATGKVNIPHNLAGNKKQPVLAAEGGVEDIETPHDIAREVIGSWLPQNGIDGLARRAAIDMGHEIASRIIAMSPQPQNNPASLSPCSTAERAAFEKWTSTKDGFNPIPHEDGGYELHDVHCAWGAWEARAAIAAMPLKPRKAMSEKEAVEIMLKGYASDPNQTLHYKCLRNAYRALSAAGAFTNTNGGDDE